MLKKRFGEDGTPMEAAFKNAKLVSIDDLEPTVIDFEQKTVGW